MEDLRDRVIQVLLAEIQNGKPIVAVVSDSTSTSKIAPLQKLFPECVVNVGIAEQGLVGTTAGLALGGYIAYTANASPFLMARSAEQVRNDVCYSNLNVKMLGLNAGVAYATLGSTHHCIEDLALLRSWGNVQIFCPADAVEAEAVIRYTNSSPCPAYIRMDSGKLPLIHNADWRFSLGKPIVYRQGKDLAIFALGTLVHEALQATEQGLDATVVNVLSFRPVDELELLDILRSHNAILSVEEHSVNTGLGSHLAMLIALNQLLCKLKICGIPDGEFAHADPRPAIRSKYRLDSQGIVLNAKELLQ